jgi:hypothetical protein
MTVLKSDYFSSHERLVRFINENNIKKRGYTADYPWGKLLYPVLLWR